jgi:hypothetical protein
MDFLSFASFFWIITLLVVTFGIYLLKYRIIICNDKISIGAYFKQKFSTRDIVAATTKRGRHSSELILKLHTGRKIIISGMVTDFNGLAEIMTSFAQSNRQDHHIR